MKLKNLDSVIHNFSHSLQSYDYTHSPKVVFDVLANHFCEHGTSCMEFDFIKGTIEPESIQNESSKQILTDYSDWLPELAKSQNSDSTDIEQFKVNISVDFDKHKHPNGMDYAVELELLTEVKFKIKGRDQRSFTLAETDVYGDKIMPEKLKQELWSLK